MKSIWRVARIGLLCYLGVLLVLLLVEKRLIFFPTPFPEGAWSPPDEAVEDAYFTATDGTELHGWYWEHREPKAVVLFAHGNAGNITHRAQVLHRLHAIGASVLLFDYRGYGKSKGSPSEAGLLMDGRAARKWLADRADVAEDEIVLIGRSLGSGVVVDLAARVGASRLVLQNAPSSLPDVAALHYPWLPVRLVMRTRFDSLSKIADYEGPILQCHAEQDRVVPYRLGKRLFEVATSEDKVFISLEGLGHNDALPSSYYQSLAEFLTDLD